MAASESQVPNLYAQALADTHGQRSLLSHESLRSVVGLAEYAADFLTCAGAAVAAYFLELYFGGHVSCPLKQVVTVATLQGIFAVLLLQRKNPKSGEASLLRIRETERALRASTQATLLLLVITFVIGVGFPRQATLIALALTPILLIAQKHALTSLLQLMHSTGYGIRRVVVYGAENPTKHVVSSLLYSPRLGLRPVGVIGDSSVAIDNSMFELGYRRSHSIPVRRGPVTPAVLKEFSCNLLIVVVPPACSEGLEEVAQIAKMAGARIALISRPPSPDNNEAGLIEVDGWQLTASSASISPWAYIFAKRASDIVLSGLLLVAFAPSLLLIGMLIRLGSSGPAIFKQKRVGKNGDLFTIYKFRSMFSGPRGDAVSPTESTDPRITSLGRFLRRTSLDELPQLINVFRGNMSLVGPRPEMPFIVERYNEEHRRRLQAVPGITGLWQLSADRALPIHENIEYDLFYLRNRTFFMDVAILLHTLVFAIGGGV